MNLNSEVIFCCKNFSIFKDSDDNYIAYKTQNSTGFWDDYPFDSKPLKIFLMRYFFLICEVVEDE